ncbi:hypothetical protein MUY27_20275 [Mucilaginibacter sp. RS28]|uniref:Uncharacterized protein n=1 Tax=Mucilaginibacter straminoryzae TaxID=2932774 RepID=A0A9X1X8F1_9SPHI|nr:hypothetical protein [Mucilaginibacter straminoryzae]MCJ8212065.1 hypothetical protein [Mucilaginibacter straminoryzae]
MSAPGQYFKFRNPFDFSPHRYEIGNPVIQNRSLEDNFYLLKVYKLSEKDFGVYYQFHLNYFSESHPNGEELFFDHVLDIVTTRINYFKRQNPISPKYAQNMANVRKLEAFLAFLKTIDHWHKLEPIESVVAEKDREIDNLKDRIIELESLLKDATRHDTSEKINITKGNIAAFMDLVKQLQDLVTPENGKLVNSQTQAPWYKMIAKYFKHGDKDISIDTARNYFPAQKDDKPAKFIEIAEKDKLFKIIPKDNK